MIPGIVEATCDYIMFSPSRVAIVCELGEERFSFFLETADLLPPRTQKEPPTFKPLDSLPLRGAFHDVVPAWKMKEGEDMHPQYLELRMQLIFGQKPTVETTQARVCVCVCVCVCLLFLSLSLSRETFQSHSHTHTHTHNTHTR